MNDGFYFAAGSASSCLWFKDGVTWQWAFGLFAWTLLCFIVFAEAQLWLEKRFRARTPNKEGT